MSTKPFICKHAWLKCFRIVCIGSINFPLVIACKTYIKKVSKWKYILLLIEPITLLITFMLTNLI